jgi:hypothetical protein
MPARSAGRAREGDRAALADLKQAGQWIGTHAGEDPDVLGCAAYDFLTLLRPRRARLHVGPHVRSRRRQARERAGTAECPPERQAGRGPVLRRADAARDGAAAGADQDRRGATMALPDEAF